jgi:CDP-diacylglycerol--glycerol-3-phosphate 3-phosphatidyltransferase
MKYMTLREKIIHSKQRAEKRVSNIYDPICYFIFNPIIPHWIHPNHITILRLFGTPFLIYFLWIGDVKVAAVMFIALALTDMIDGTLARRREQITELGTLLDPIADKLLLGSVIIFLLLKINIALACLVVGLDLVAVIFGVIMKLSGSQLSFKANLWGKIKLNLQVVGVAMVFIGLIFNIPLLIVIAQGILWASIAFAVISSINGGA